MRDLTLLDQVFVLGQRLNLLVDTTLEATPLDHFDFALYGALVRSGPLTASELADRLAVPRTTVLDRLRPIEARGDLRRLPHPHDGRAQNLDLTARGRRAWRATDAAWEPMRRLFEAKLSDPAAVAETLRELEAATLHTEASVRRRRRRAAS
jgi:DNA-binding MarR family transcriptional regulator